MKITTRPFFTMVQHLRNIIFLLLFVLPGSATWSPEDYLDSIGTPYGSTTNDALSVAQRDASADFISQEKLQEFAVQMNNSWDRLGGIEHSTVTDDQFLADADLIFRIHKGIYSNKSVLLGSTVNGRRINRQLTTIRKFSVNQPFVDSVPSTASSIRIFVDSVTNGTSRPGDHYYWVGGDVSDFNLRRSRVRRLSAYCNALEIVHYDRETKKAFRTENITWSIHPSLSRQYFVYIYPREHGSPLCYVPGRYGDSLFLKEHGDLSQRLMRATSDHLATTWIGKIDQGDLNLGNPGNVLPKIHIVNSTVIQNNVYFNDVVNAFSKYYGTQKWCERRSLWLQAEEAFEQSLVAYNNFGLLLSITALASSTIISIVIVRKASNGELAVLVMEGFVVLLFLIVLSHALAVYSRADDYVYDYEVRQTTLSQYFNDSNNSVIRVRGFFQRREGIVGKRHGAPVMLIVAEVCVIISSLVLLDNIIRLLWNRLKNRQDRMCSRIKKFRFNRNENSVNERDSDVGSKCRRDSIGSTGEDAKAMKLSNEDGSQ